jgi:hypothetical protein
LAPLWRVLPREAERGVTLKAVDAQARSTSAYVNHYVSTRRMAHALRWVEALLKTMLQGDLVRKFPYNWEDVPLVHIVTDASPYGIGAYVWTSSGPTAWFSEPVHKIDLKALGVTAVSIHITVLEGVAIMLALRTLVSQCVRVALKGDSLSALEALRSASARSPGLNAVIAEIAFDTAVKDVYLVSLTHVPGLANVDADALSRMYAPVPVARPAAFKDSSRVRPPDSAFRWHTRRPPTERGFINKVATGLGTPRAASRPVKHSQAPRARSRPVKHSHAPRARSRPPRPQLAESGRHAPNWHK